MTRGYIFLLRFVQRTAELPSLLLVSNSRYEMCEHMLSEKLFFITHVGTHVGREMDYHLFADSDRLKLTLPMGSENSPLLLTPKNNLVLVEIEAIYGLSR